MITRRGVVQAVKESQLNKFLNEGWSLLTEKTVSKIGKAKATADVIEEEITPQVEEVSSMPKPKKEGDE